MAEISQTLDRGLIVLDLIARSEIGLSVAEIAQELELPRTVVHRLLTTLAARALIRRDSAGRYRPGLGLLAMASSVEPLLRDSALPILRRLADEVGATAHLTVRDGDDAVAIAVVEPSNSDVHVAYRVGARHGIERGAAGRALTADAGTWVSSDGELQPRAHGISAPCAALGISASIGVVSLSALDDAAVGARVLAAAKELARALS